VLVQVPPGSKMKRRATQLVAGGVVVDYRRRTTTESPLGADKK
jgi:hypothetical protein